MCLQVMGQFCLNKDTITLKTMCSQLALKPLYLDEMLLFDKPATILQPLLRAARQLEVL